MADQSDRQDADDPTHLREEVEEELDELIEETSEEEARRLRAREAGDVDEPSDPS